MPNSRRPRAVCRAADLFGSGVGGCRHQARARHASVPGVEQVQSTTLANGMKVIVWTDRDIPNVALYNWVRVGSRNEVPGITGPRAFLRAHDVQRHRASARRASSTGSWKRRAAPTTRSRSDNVTVYQDWFPRSGARPGLRSRSPIASRISSFDPKVIESERGVVYSERRLRVEDNNQGFLVEQVQATAFVAHPYQIPDHRLAGRHPGLEDRRPAEVLQDQLRAEQLHAGPGGRLSAPKKASRSRRNISSRFRGRSRRRRCAPPSPSSSARSACRRARRADAAASLRLQVARGQRSAGPGHQSADVDPRRWRLLAPASPAGRGEEARDRGRRLISRKASIPG